MRTAPWTSAEVLQKLETSPIFVERALLYLYHRQTVEEQRLRGTYVANGAGFNAFDAEILTSFASQVERSGLRPEGRRLSERQQAVARTKLKKYVRQLLEHANAKVAAVA